MGGSVYRAENGTWSFRFTIDKDPLTGQRKVTAKRGFTTRKAAETALRDAIETHEAGRHVQPSARTLETILNGGTPPSAPASGPPPGPTTAPT